MIGPAEWVGEAAHDANGFLRIGEGSHVVAIPLQKPGYGPGWWNTGTVHVYVRRLEDGNVAEILMAQHDGLAVEAERANPEFDVCPDCDGEDSNCKTCEGWGLVPTTRHGLPGIYQETTTTEGTTS